MGQRGKRVEERAREEERDGKGREDVKNEGEQRHGCWGQTSLYVRSRCSFRSFFWHAYSCSRRLLDIIFLHYSGHAACGKSKAQRLEASYVVFSRRKIIDTEELWIGGGAGRAAGRATVYTLFDGMAYNRPRCPAHHLSRSVVIGARVCPILLTNGIVISCQRERESTSMKATRMSASRNSGGGYGSSNCQTPPACTCTAIYSYSCNVLTFLRRSTIRVNSAGTKERSLLKITEADYPIICSHGDAYIAAVSMKLE